MVKIETLKKGDYFFLPNKKTPYVYDGYNRSTKKYSSYKFEDINHFREFKKRYNSRQRKRILIMKKILALYNSLNEEEFLKIMNNCKNEMGESFFKATMRNEATDLKNDITGLFNFKRSPEGFDYWYKIYTNKSYVQR